MLSAEAFPMARRQPANLSSGAAGPFVRLGDMTCTAHDLLISHECLFGFGIGQKYSHACSLSQITIKQLVLRVGRKGTQFALGL